MSCAKAFVAMIALTKYHFLFAAGQGAGAGLAPGLCDFTAVLVFPMDVACHFGFEAGSASAALVWSNFCKDLAAPLTLAIATRPHLENGVPL